MPTVSNPTPSAGAEKIAKRTYEFSAEVSTSNTAAIDNEFFVQGGAFPADVVGDLAYPVRLNVTIADNANYDNADIYYSDYTVSGYRIGVDIYLPEVKTYYIKMVAEDTTGATSTTTEYTIDAVNNITISNKDPVPDSVIPFEIRSYSAELSDSLNRDLRLIATIADNPDYNNSVKYTSDFVPSGSRAEVFPKMDIEGTNYIKMQAEDDQGVLSDPVEEYQFEVDAVYNPQPSNEVNIGIEKYEATVSTDNKEDIFFMGGAFPANARYTPNVKLKITIADNSSYTDADVYETTFVKNGERPNIEYGITAPGTYYIKMEAIGAEGGSYTKEYTITAVQVLYFIEEPSINTTGPKANKVIVKSPTASATATTDPAPNSDEIVEKLVEIEEGDATVCQNVADELIARWGREQITISGPVNLTVSLKFKEKVEVIVPNLGINKYMVLQKKNHRVTERITDVVFGDIQLSESELLSRILDELEI